MIVGEYCFAHLLQQCERALRAGPKARGDQHSFDELTRGVVLIAAENGEALRGSESIRRRFEAIDDALASGLFGDWAQYERIPFDAAAALVNGTASKFINSFEFISTLAHPQSSIRGFGCRIAWVMRSHLTKDDVGNLLLENVACTLGYVELSAGLARSLFESPKEFFDAASAYTPMDQRFDSQYRDRIDDLRDRNLIEVILLDLVSEEAQLRKKLSQQLFALSLPSVEARSPRQLEIPIPISVASASNSKSQPASPSKVAICPHLAEVSLWPVLKSALSLYESSHLDYGVARCGECQQAYLTCFWEQVDFEGGKDLMWNIRMPLNEDEVRELERLHEQSKQANDYLLRIGDYFDRDRDKLVWHPDNRYETTTALPMRAMSYVD